MPNEKLKELRTKAMRLPLTPGVYLMKDKNGKIIYVGKAKALKNRVSQYFGSDKNHGIKVRKMVENVTDFDFILCDSEFEALVLECSLIKQYNPKYNILLKDDKGYHYIEITKPPYRKIREAKKKLDNGSEYLGPYTSSFAVKNTVDETQNIFKLPKCNKSFPRDIGKGRPCLNYFISLCSAPCARKITEKEYNEAIEEAIDFIKGGSDKAISQMKKRMEEYAENLEFEKAAKMRDRINAIGKLNEKQKVVSNEVKNQDIFAIATGPEKACISVLRFNDGRLCDNEDFIIDAVKDLPQARSEVITRYYELRDTIPLRIVVDGEVADAELLEEWLTKKKGRKVIITVPQRGEQAKLVSMCSANAAEKLAQSEGLKGNQAAQSDELAKLLGLKKVPVYIEAYDISHTGGSDNVAGMVVFKNALPYPKGYKKFAIKGFVGQDDYASMAEVLDRRFARYVDGDENFAPLPDLILLDGGEGQVNAVLPVMRKYNINIPIFGMVKDDRHRTRAITANGEIIAINSKRQVFTLVSNIQEEVHRFAYGYHRKKHTKSTLTSSLTQIEGIGEKIAKDLMKHFKTITAIKNASLEELCKVKGISEKKAESIINFFGRND